MQDHTHSYQCRHGAIIRHEITDCPPAIRGPYVSHSGNPPRPVEYIKALLAAMRGISRRRGRTALLTMDLGADNLVIIAGNNGTLAYPEPPNPAQAPCGAITFIEATPGDPPPESPATPPPAPPVPVTPVAPITPPATRTAITTPPSPGKPTRRPKPAPKPAKPAATKPVAKPLPPGQMRLSKADRQQFIGALPAILKAMTPGNQRWHLRRYPEDIALI